MRSFRLVLIFSVILFAYQNCSKVSFSSKASGGSNVTTSSTPEPPVVVEPPVDDPPVDPPAPPPAEKPVAALHGIGSSNPHHRCAITVAGNTYCWGMNDRGQLGNSIGFGVAGNEMNHTALLVAGGLHFVEIEVGDYNSCGRLADGTTYCWGDIDHNASGSFTPREIIGRKFKKLSAGFNHMCGIDMNDDAYCWGYAMTSSGGGTLPFSMTPSLVPGGIKYSQIATGVVSDCGLSTAGDVYCWGINLFGVFGTLINSYNFSGPTPSAMTAPQKANLPVKFKQLAPWSYSLCGLTNDGQVYCWGGLQAVVGSPGNSPVVLNTALRFTQIVGGYYYCGLTAEKKAYCWNSRASASAYPNPLKVSDDSFAQIAGGSRTACGVTTAGSVKCWDFVLNNDPAVWNSTAAVSSSYAISIQ